MKVAKDNGIKDFVLKWVNSVAQVAPNQDASGGALKAALTSPTLDVYVTSDQYEPARVNFTCLNVMVNRKDYRLIIGYDNNVVRVENLDARATRAQTREDVANHAPVNTGVPGAPEGEDPYGNYGPGPVGTEGEDPNYGLATDPVPANPTTLNPYGVGIPANH